MVKWSAIPLKEVNGVRFGMSREEVRATLNTSFREFKKSKYSQNTTDDFGTCHVFYDAEDRCEAIEIFDECQVTVNGNVVFPVPVQTVKQYMDDLTEEYGSYTSRKLSIGLYAPDGTPESILFGAEGYFA